VLTSRLDRKNERGLATDQVSQLCLAQATVLNQVGMMFSGNIEMAEYAEMNMSHIALICKKASDPSKCGATSSATDHLLYGSKEWEAWTYEESFRRLAYLSWLLDCQFALYFNLSPTLTIDLLQVPMPSSQALWMAESQNSWLSAVAVGPGASSTYSLRQALDELYRSRETLCYCTELTRLLLTFGVYFDDQRGLDAGVCLDILRMDEDRITSTETLGRLTLEHNHLLNVLLQLPLRELMAFTGWRVNEVQRHEADLRMAHWVRSEPVMTRFVVYHAAKAYNYIRGRPFRTYSDTMTFLTSTMAMWAVTISIDHDPQPSLPFANDHPFGLGRLRTLRFDKPTDHSAILGWVSGTADARPYLSGVGALEDSTATPLLIRESVRVLQVKLQCPFSDVVSKILQSQFELKP
jgi:hypothetical protein